MRLAFFVIPIALLANACSMHRFANGTVSYTSTPPTADHSGALPLSPLVCLDDQKSGLRPNVAIQVGGKCVLSGHYYGHQGRSAPPGGEASMVATGVCEVPTAAGLLPLQIANTTLQISYESVDLTLGGTTNDGRYVTYRFTGLLGEEDQSEDCNDLFKQAPDVTYAAR